MTKTAVKKSVKAVERVHNPVKSILVSQPEPSDLESPYYKLAEKYKLKILFRPFIKVEPLEVGEFRKQKINILAHTGVIFTSRNAVDNFFRVCASLKVEMPPDMKYYCISDQTANYLQKYILIRKRKLFVGSKTSEDLINVLKKHKNEKLLYPCSNIRKEEIPVFLQKNGYNYKEAIIYKTVASDLSDLADIKYDILAFFSPSGINSLFKNFPDFVQGNTRIAVFGSTTAKAARDANLIVDVEAPVPSAPSMTGALEQYIKKVNNIK